jgi:hypothetical protein
MRQGECGWCRREKDEVFDVTFSDKSFVGPMCKADLLRAIGMKVGAEPKSTPPCAAGNGATVTK